MTTEKRAAKTPKARSSKPMAPKKSPSARKRNAAAAAPKPSRRPTIFISYRHAAPTTEVARKLLRALGPATEVWNADAFMDEKDLEPSDLFDSKIIAALDRTDHFIVLLTNDYWSSEYCRKELGRIVERFEDFRSVRILFVKTEELDPGHFTLSRDRAAGRINSRDPVIQKIGDVQFLGPFNDQLQLVRLEWENPAKLSDQVAQLVRSLGRVIAK